jgi:hypothetical protein
MKMKFSGLAKMSTCWRKLVAKMTQMGPKHNKAKKIKTP